MATPTARPALRSRAAAWAVVVANQGLAGAYTKRLLRARPHVVESLGGAADVVQIATVGLLRAAELYDPDRGLQFSTYADIHMRAAVTRAYYASDPVRIPGYVRGEERAALRERFRALSLSVLSRDDHDLDPAAATEDAGGPDADDLARLRAAVAELPRRLRDVIRWHYLDGMTLAQIGGRLGCTKEWVRQLSEQGLARLRRLLGAEAAEVSA